MEDKKEVIPRNTDKKRIEALEAELAKLQGIDVAFSQFSQAVIHVFHVLGAPHDILIKHGVTPYKKEEDGKAA